MAGIGWKSRPLQPITPPARRSSCQARPPVQQGERIGMTRGFLAAAALALMPLIVPSRAAASGGVWCEAKDDNLAFDFSAGQSRDGAGWWFGIQGSVVSKVDKL